MKSALRKIMHLQMNIRNTIELLNYHDDKFCSKTIVVYLESILDIMSLD